MQTSRPIEVRGQFVGVAVTRGRQWRFVATAEATAPLAGTHHPTPQAAQAAAARLIAATRPSDRGYAR